MNCSLFYNADNLSKYTTYIELLLLSTISGFGGLEVACWPLVPKFAGSYPVEAVGFFKGK